ncbi:PREDICTED: cysteine proteinase 1-like [Camelina sativa]|uniref:Cysteine proteinase 1-like n=2 Tax=Camelina sativa TaxID=90675 RepID=A0ABM0VBW2_CAMSA|nr:PREDICTED: cysteine proteinase 1-like [Camelina sativa]
MEKKDDDGGVGAGRIGGIGAGGGKGKGKNVPNERKAEAEARRKAQQDCPQVNEHPPRDFGDGSYLIKDWSHSHRALLSIIVKQVQAICWALVLGKILEFTYNKNRPIAQHKFLDIDSFAEKVKLKPGELIAQKKLDTDDMAVGSLRNAMDHIFLKGIEKIDGRKKGGAGKAYAIKGRFVGVQNSTAEDIVRKVDIGLVGLTVDIDEGLRTLKKGIYRVPKPQVGALKHALTIVGYGMTKEDELFFLVQNTWGTGWGDGGYGRMIITDTCDMFYLAEVINDKKKKEEALA